MPFCHLTLRGSRWCFEPPLKTLGDHLRRRRATLQLEQRQVATLIGVHPDTIRNWESNRTTPVNKHVPAILDFLGYVPEVTEDGFPASFTLREAKSGDDFTARLTLARRLLGLTQGELAAQLGVDESSVWHWENGHHQPIRRHRERIEALCGTSECPDELERGECDS